MRPGNVRLLRRLTLSLLMIMGLLATSAARPEAAPAPAATPAPAAPPSLLAPPLPFDEAVLYAANELFSKAILPPGSDRIEVVIDPLIDATTGAQTAATRAIEKRIVELARRSYPRFEVKPFSSQALAGSPVVLVGTFTAIKNADPGAAGHVYRICLALADLRSKTILSKGARRARPEGVDPTPAPAFADSPVWTGDPAVESYIKICQGTKPGDPLNPVYARVIGAAALVSDAIGEYEAGRYREALAFYRTALKLPGGDQTRVRNGVYLTLARLSRREEATGAFGDMVDYSLKTGKLSVRILFRPGSTRFIDDRQVSAPYPMWLSQIATRAYDGEACLDIVGHTSPTGPAALNERLSTLRAQYIRDLLQGAAPRLGGRLTASGVGPRENLIGTGRDDASDAIDRRVEFKVRRC